MLELSFYNPLKIFLANKALYLNLEFFFFFVNGGKNGALGIFRVAKCAGFFFCFLNKKIHKHLSNIDGPKDEKRSWFFSLTNFSLYFEHPSQYLNRTAELVIM